MCANEPAECKNSNILTTSDCTTARISFYCPILCGKCGAVEPSTIAATSTTSTTIKIATTTATSKCSLLPCLNGAKQDTITCKCDCKHFDKETFSF